MGFSLSPQCTGQKYWKKTQLADQAATADNLHFFIKDRTIHVFKKKHLTGSVDIKLVEIADLGRATQRWAIRIYGAGPLRLWHRMAHRI